MALNLKNGIPIALIVGGKYDGEILHIDTNYGKKQIKYESDEDSYDSEYSDEDSYDSEDSETENEYFGKKIRLSTGSKFQPIPDITKEREIDYVTGKSGSGKSYFIGQKAMNYKALNPKKPIYIFSMKNKDPAIDKLGGIRIPINENLIDHPIDIHNEIKGGALIIFDDVNPDTIVDKNLIKAIDILRLKILEYGRSNGVSLMITSHLISPNERKFGRVILNELNNLVIFPLGGSRQQQEYILTKHLGYSNKEADKILSMPSRWIQLSNNAPQYILTENQCILA